jgi:hypothetical protein
VPDPNRALFESVVRLLGPVLDDQAAARCYRGGPR